VGLLFSLFCAFVCWFYRLAGLFLPLLVFLIFSLLVLLFFCVRAFCGSFCGSFCFSPGSWCERFRSFSLSPKKPANNPMHANWQAGFLVGLVLLAKAAKLQLSDAHFANRVIGGVSCSDFAGPSICDTLHTTT